MGLTADPVWNTIKQVNNINTYLMVVDDPARCFSRWYRLDEFGPGFFYPSVELHRSIFPNTNKFSPKTVIYQ